MRRVHTFVPIDSELEVQRLKRAGQEVLEEPANRQKIGEASGSGEEGFTEKEKEVKYPIIDWETFTKESKSYWRIIKVGNHIEVYQIFEDMLKRFDRDDLEKFWDLVKKRFRSTETTVDKEKMAKSILNNVNTAGPSINTASINFNNGSLNINTVNPTVTPSPLKATHADFFSDESELDISNITTIYLVPSTPNTRIHKDHSLDNVIGDVQSSVQIRRMTKTTNEQGFISAVYEGKTHKDLHNCLFACFLSQEDPKKRAIRTKWVYRNKKDKRGIVIRNKARLVAQGYTQEEGIDYDDIFAPVARIEAIRLFLAYASFKDFVVYQIDVKSEFLYGKIEKEVYVYQPLGFEDPEFPDKVYKVEKALYGLHQAPRAWYDTLSTYILDNRFKRGQIDKSLFIKKIKVTQKDDEIFISQDKYVEEILKKFSFSTVKTASTPMDTSKPLLKDTEAEDVDVHLYRSMIGSLMYLTASRHDIMFVVCACVRFQVTPKGSHLHAVKRIFRYLKDRKSTTRGCQFLRSRLILWNCKKQTIVATSTTEAEYALTKNPTIYVYLIEKFWQTATVRTVDNREQEITATVDGKEFTITKAFVRRHLQLADVDGHPSEPQPPPSTAQPTNEEPIPNVVSSSHQKTQTPRQALTKVTELPQTSEPIPNVPDEAIYEEWDDRVERATTIAASLDAKQASGAKKPWGFHCLTRSERVPTPPRDLPILRVHTLGSDEGSMTLHELTVLCTMLSKKMESLEADLKQTNKVYGAAYTKLIKNVKKLEKTIKSNQSRRREKIVVSNDEEDSEDSSKQGRMIEEIDQDTGVTLLKQMFTPILEEEGELVLVNISIPSPVVVKDKGKGKMEEYEDEQTKKTKLQQEQERLGHEATVRLQEVIDEKERQRMARVHEAAQSFTEEEWENIRARVEADEELTQRLHAEERNKYNEVDQAKMLVDLINQRKRYFAA
ncbi:putative ribonuclease H-like domain-containing protein [Tanacetum coccineum]